MIKKYEASSNQICKGIKSMFSKESHHQLFFHKNNELAH